jgi:hypothetical protein
MYGLPKTHKAGIPLRPILSSIGSFNYACAQWLSQGLKPLREHIYSVVDTFSFVANLKGKSFHNELMYTFDVKSLFTNIPVDFTINLILSAIFRDGAEDFKGLNKRRLKSLLGWCTNHTTFQFNSEYYSQIDGVAMGSPLAPLMADVCMNYILDEAMKRVKPSQQPSVLYRYVDDLFLVFRSGDDADSFFDILNQIHKNIQFTKETEINSCISFLDVRISRSTEGPVKTSVYRKPTDTSLYSKWSSYIPFQYKRNLVKCLLDRAYKICSTYMGMHAEFQNIKYRLAKNGYPRNFVDTCINQLLNKKHHSNSCKDSSEDIKPDMYTVVKFPFLGDVSHHIRNEIQQFLFRYTTGKIRTRFINTTNPISNFFRYKDRQELLLRANVVYRLTCNCGAAYIGETKRNLITRVKEHHPAHNKLQNSEVCVHLNQFPSHAVDFKNPEILGYANTYKRLLILETLHIKNSEPILNADVSSVPLYLFNA